MKEQILRLCRRLNKFTLDEIVTISEIESEDIKYILDELVSANLIILSNGYYFYKKKFLKNNVKIAKFFEYHSKETNILILKCFCADIPVLKVADIVEPSKSAVSNYYAFFRNLLYNNQHSELEKAYKDNPKIPSIRALYDKKIYLYNYNGEIYISANRLKSDKEEKHHTNKELLASNKAYYKIRREFQNFAYTQSFAQIAYSKYWLDGKTMEEKFNFINDFLNIA